MEVGLEEVSWNQLSKAVKMRQCVCSYGASTWRASTSMFITSDAFFMKLMKPKFPKSRKGAK